MNEENTTPPVNTQAILSLIFGISTILLFCGGSLPIPFSGFICFPLSVFFGLLALIFGIVSLNRIRKHNHSGHPMAWTGILIGGFVFICVMCMVIAMISFLMFSPNSIHMPPFIEQFQI